MVRALLEGRKTQTRRQGDKPKYAIGDLIWVREAFVLECNSDYVENPLPPTDRPFKLDGERLIIPLYRATEPDVAICDKNGFYDEARGTKWGLSIFMPKWTSRITLEIIGVKVERLQDITLKDAQAEGLDEYSELSPQETYAKLWDKIYASKGKPLWADNPLVCAYKFRVFKHNISNYRLNEAEELRAKANAELQASAGDIAAREKANELDEQVQQAEDFAKRQAKQKANVNTGGRAAGIRTTYRPEITDLNLAVKYFWQKNRHDFEALVLQLAKEEERTGNKEINGVKFIAESKVI